MFTTVPDLTNGLHGEDRLYFIESLIEVYDPYTGQSVPLIPNAMQRDIIMTLQPREITLKSRRAGLTSIYVADFWADIITQTGVHAEIFAHDKETAEAIFEQIVRFQYERIPEDIRPVASTDNVREFKFKELDSYIKVQTVGQSEEQSKKKGQARAITHLLMTEFGFYAYAEAFFSKIINCVPVVGGKVYIDSTPNGQNSFYNRYTKNRRLGDKANYKARFYPWWWDAQNMIGLEDGESITPSGDEIAQLALKVKEYGIPHTHAHVIKGLGLTQEQLKFRRYKIANLEPKGNLTARDVFIVEYPEDDQSCFLHSGRSIFQSRYLEVMHVARDAHEGHKHSIGHDSSLGDNSGHPAGITIIDIELGEQVYEWRGWAPVDSQVEMLIELQKRYPGVIVPERNYPGDSVIILLKKLGVKHIYKHKQKELGEGKNVKPWKLKAGFPTSAATKPRVFVNLELALSNGDLTLCGQKTIDDLKGYRYGEDDKIEFEAGLEHQANAGEFSHGELGIALALAWHGRSYGNIGVA